jgi:hypothetical protein
MDLDGLADVVELLITRLIIVVKLGPSSRLGYLASAPGDKGQLLDCFRTIPCGLSTVLLA